MTARFSMMAPRGSGAWRRMLRVLGRGSAASRSYKAHGRRIIVAAAGLLTTGAVRAAETAARSPQASGVDAGSLLRLTGGLALVVLLIVALSWLLKRSGRFTAPGGGQLRVLAGVSVGQRERVVLLKVGEKQLLVGVAPGRVQTLHVLDEPIEGLEPPARDMQMSPFAQRLHRVMRQHEKRQ